MWAGAEPSLQETQTKGTDKAGVGGITSMQTKSWSFWIPESPRKSSTSWRELQPPHWASPEHWRSLLEPGPSLQPQGWHSPSCSCFLSCAHWQRLRELYLTKTLPEFFHSADISPVKSLEKSWLGYTPKESHFWGGLKLNKAKIPVPNSHWHINSAIEHKTDIFQIFVLKIPLSFRI